MEWTLPFQVPTEETDLFLPLSLASFHCHSKVGVVTCDGYPGMQEKNVRASELVCGHPSVSAGESSRIPIDIKTLGCSSALYKMAYDLHMTYTHPPSTLNYLSIAYNT